MNIVHAHLLRIVLFLLSWIATAYCEKVLIITHNYNRPDFIEMQYKTFKKYLRDDYEYVVFNDATNNSMEKQIQDMCARYGIRCIRIPQEVHTRPYHSRNPGDNLQAANIRHANCIQFSLDVLGFDHDGIVCIFDADLFPIRPFSIVNHMKDKDISSFISTPRDKHYLCPIFCMLAMNRLPDKRSINFNVGIIDEVPADTGALTYHYLKSHPKVTVDYVNVVYSYQLFLEDTHSNIPGNETLSDEAKRMIYTRLYFNHKEIEFFLKKPSNFELYLHNTFLHYRGGSNHMRDAQKYVNEKNKIFYDFIQNILN